jgi:hypothetical protein
MSSEEDEMSLRRWRNLLRTELSIVFEELSQSRKDGADERFQHYVACCAEQYGKIIAGTFRGAQQVGTSPMVQLPDRS